MYAKSNEVAHVLVYPLINIIIVEAEKEDNAEVKRAEQQSYSPHCMEGQTSGYISSITSYGGHYLQPGRKPYQMLLHKTKDSISIVRAVGLSLTQTTNQYDAQISADLPCKVEISQRQQDCLGESHVWVCQAGR